MTQQLVAPPTAWPAAPPRELLQHLGPIPAFFLDTYRRHGPVVRLRMGPMGDLVVLNGLEANQFVSRYGQSHLRMSEFRRAQNEAYGATKTMVSSDGAEHSRLRKLQKRGYSRDALAARSATIAALVAEEQMAWREDVPVPVVAMATRLVGRLIGGCVLGHDPAESVPALSSFLQTVIKVTLAGEQPAATLAQPAFLQARQRAYDLADATIAAHGCPVHGHGRPDLVDDLLRAVEADPALLSPADLRVAVLGPYIGGLEPVAHTLAFALYALVSDPALGARVAAEVRANLADPAACVEHVERMPALRALVQETLRRYPVTPVLRGTAARAFTFAGFQIEAGESVAIGIAVPHFLPELYPDPLRFDIDRFGAEGPAQRRPGAFAPFGLGSHACLGAGLAEAMLQSIIALILSSFDLACDPPSYQLRIAASNTPAPDQQFQICVRPVSAS